MYEDFGSSPLDTRVDIFIKFINECQWSLKSMNIVGLSCCLIQYYMVVIIEVNQWKSNIILGRHSYVS